jgi:hypothetical protein
MDSNDDFLETGHILPPGMEPKCGGSQWKNSIPVLELSRDMDGSQLADIIQQEETRPISDIQDGRETTLKLMRMRGQASQRDDIRTEKRI